MVHCLCLWGIMFERTMKISVRYCAGHAHESTLMEPLIGRAHWTHSCLSRSCSTREASGAGSCWTRSWRAHAAHGGLARGKVPCDVLSRRVPLIAARCGSGLMLDTRPGASSMSPLPHGTAMSGTLRGLHAAAVSGTLCRHRERDSLPPPLAGLSGGGRRGRWWRRGLGASGMSGPRAPCRRH